MTDLTPADLDEIGKEEFNKILDLIKEQDQKKNTPKNSSAK
jgi:hypothetical protein